MKFNKLKLRKIARHQWKHENCGETYSRSELQKNLKKCRLCEQGLELNSEDIHIQSNFRKGKGGKNERERELTNKEFVKMQKIDLKKDKKRKR